MGFFEFRSTKEKKSAIKNIVAVMHADGKVTDEEQACLQLICTRMEFSTKQLAEILSNPESITFTAPKDSHERACQMVDIVSMMLADGAVNQEEMDMCVSFARSLNFPQLEISDIIQGIIVSLQIGESPEHVSSKVESMIGLS